MDEYLSHLSEQLDKYQKAQNEIDRQRGAHLLILAMTGKVAALKSLVDELSAVNNFEKFGGDFDAEALRAIELAALKALGDRASAQKVIKTRQEVQDLKYNWECDPCYDLGKVEGFEEYSEELVEFQAQAHVLWNATRYKQKLLDKATELGVPGNVQLAEYVILLELRLTRLEARLDD